MDTILNPKQQKIAMLVTEGLSNKEIAETLNITTGTVKNYLRVIYDLTGMDTRLELAMWWNAHNVKELF
jgi:DNA-binding NarL/FixJ family response regulator